MQRIGIWVITALACLLPENALAHLVNPNVGEFYAGMMHPLTSAEHLLPILALAAVVGQKSRDAARRVVFVFPLALMAAIVAGDGYSSLTWMQTVNLLVLIALGAMVLIADRASVKTVIAASVFLGLVLGYRSGVDMSFSNVSYRFIPGVGLTGFICVTLVTSWFPATTSKRARIITNLAGITIVIAGLYLLVDRLVLGRMPESGIAGLPSEAYLIELVRSPTLSVPIIVGTIIAVTGWGAAHAITPGHGKAIVAAFLVGSKSTAWHAVWLGLTVTATHTLGVFALGLLSIFASQYWTKEDLLPWIETASGLMIFVIGISLVVRFLRARSTDHDHSHGHGHLHHHTDGGSSSEDAPLVRAETHHHHHDHHHLPADGSAITWKGLIGLGIAGGLLPCPSALVLLLAAISLDRIGFGMLLVAAFSLGLASVLTIVGLLFVKGRGVLESAPRMMALGRILPLVSSLLIVVIGAAIIIRALAT